MKVLPSVIRGSPSPLGHEFEKYCIRTFFANHHAIIWLYVFYPKTDLHTP